MIRVRAIVSSDSFVMCSRREKLYIKATIIVYKNYAKHGQSVRSSPAILLAQLADSTNCRINVAKFSSSASSELDAPTCAVLLIVRMNPLSRFQRLERRPGILNETVTGVFLLRIDSLTLRYVTIILHPSPPRIAPWGAVARAGSIIVNENRSDVGLWTYIYHGKA